ncbi:monosaccharide ABC transporter membrane protein, CUT2 family [Duganella sp. CF458]|uniref:ABC transporter permease n=1 Tax=Duganella sp. CF458 TaxID=1884368 RepID=UPI0008ECEEE4|nr:monosaccharide ABC transporter membrane protein, CUT2 family [Duganella sp. CF458]
MTHNAATPAAVHASATASASSAAQGMAARLSAHPLARPLGALLVLLLVNLFAVPGFFHLEVKDGHLYGAVVDILNRAAPLMLAATGMTIVIAMRGIDISVGAVVALAAAVACTMVAAEQPLWLAFAAALGAALLCGIWNGLLVAGLGLQPIVATLVLMVAGRGLAQLVTDGQIITVYRDDFFVLGSGYLLGLPVALYVALTVVAGAALAMRKTALGLFTQAVGINPVAARLAGVRAGALVFASYACCAVCAGLAGLIISSNIKSADANNAGLLLELDAILAVTLGGTSLAGGKFNLVGSVIGALIIQTLTYTVYSLGVPPEVNLVVKSAVVFAVCLSQRSKA